MHVDGGLECVAAGVPVLVEKPIGDNVASATRLVEAGEKAGVPVLTGHHRNYSPIMTKAREIIQSGVLGTLVGVSGTALFYKPDDYFDVGDGWRREPGGGPILLNLTHEVNNLLSLLGDIDTVMAVTSNSTRGFPVEDTSAMIFRFANGALGTFLLSDTAASARSWEQTSRENTSYATYDDEDAYHIAGTRGSLSVPTMRMKTYEDAAVVVGAVHHLDRERRAQRPAGQPGEAFRRRHPRQGAEPICSGRDGLKTMKVVDAVVESARTGQPVSIAN